MAEWNLNLKYMCVKGFQGKLKGAHKYDRSRENKA